MFPSLISVKRLDATNALFGRFNLLMHAQELLNFSAHEVEPQEQWIGL